VFAIEISMLYVKKKKEKRRKKKERKEKAVPIQAWTGPEGSRRLWLPDFKTIGT
jgi:hypothetical protein